MKSLPFISLLLVGLCAGDQWWSGYYRDIVEQPSFCRNYECPQYKVMSTTENYEVREYPKSKWVTAEMSMSEDYWEDWYDRRGAYSKLYSYFHGANDRHQVLNRTVPVLMAHSKDNVIMGFVLPEEFSDNPPQPTEPGINIYEAPQGQVYVTSFGGPGHTWFYNRFEVYYSWLKNVLDANGEGYENAVFYTAIYDAPWRWMGRHNEVWISKK